MAPSQLKGLYIITDPKLTGTGQTLLNNVEQALQGGVQLVQYRNKQASKQQKLSEADLLSRLCEQYGSSLIINDDLSIAKALNCGIHLGLEDASIQEAREQLRTDAIIGATCHNSLTHAASAINQGADYIAFGRLFNSPSKPNAPKAELSTLKIAKARWPDITVVAIGGITLENSELVLSAGADLVATIAGIWNTPNITNTADAFNNIIAGHHLL